MELVTANYASPVIKQRVRAKTALAPDQLGQRFGEWGRKTGEDVVLTGASSAGEYAVMAREPIQSFYCSNLDRLLKRFGAQCEETSRFPNVELIETDEEFLYFDARKNLTASPVQAYLEIMRGDNREQETAEQLREAILQPLKEKG